MASFQSTTASTTTVAGDPQAPLMRHLLAEFAATGLPPAYLELDDASSDPEPSA